MKTERTNQKPRDPDTPSDLPDDKDPIPPQETPPFRDPPIEEPPHE